MINSTNDLRAYNEKLCNQVPLGTYVQSFAFDQERENEEKEM